MAVDGIETALIERCLAARAVKRAARNVRQRSAMWNSERRLQRHERSRRARIKVIEGVKTLCELPWAYTVKKLLCCRVDGGEIFADGRGRHRGVGGCCVVAHARVP